ncbi:unnamed protein product [Fraxinus pennsylvanica]|uniref:Uncharacterized protein n=1 Tax=Fraxinus pennsylvanica TaxID=56036 RepID=A0AAD1YSX0_9LAMI|nr:unnamed protein product [Fraxinus pennsylvanica]
MFKGALYMKFAWRFPSSDSLWAKIFRAKYFKHGILDIGNLSYIGTRFWRSVRGCLPEVIERSQWKIRDGSCSFWFDKWIESGPLCAQVTQAVEPKLKINEICLHNGWDMVRLRDLVGDTLANEVVSKVKWKMLHTFKLWRLCRQGVEESCCLGGCAVEGKRKLGGKNQFMVDKSKKIFTAGMLDSKSNYLEVSLNLSNAKVLTSEDEYDLRMLEDSHVKDHHRINLERCHSNINGVSTSPSEPGNPKSGFF